MKVLVLGGAGYIGSHVAKALAARGDTPIVFDSLVAGRRSFVKWGPLIEGDIRDPVALDRAFKDYQPDAVMHFAASIEVGIGEQKPLEFWDNNVTGSLRVLEAMTRHDCSRIVFSSTCAVYGEPTELPLRESHARNPINTYGRTKLAVEMMLEGAARSGALRYAALRYFNACGASPDGDIGEEHDPETHLIPNALKAAAGLGGAMQVFGTDYDTPDGSCLRDFIHVDDLAAGHLSALDHLAAGAESFACNLGTGRGVSVLDVLRAIEVELGRPVPAEHHDRRPGDPPILYSDTRKSTRLLGFEPRRSDIGTIIRDAWHYHRQHWPLTG